MLPGIQPALLMGAAPGYQIARSLRFNPPNLTRLNRTFSGAYTDATKGAIKFSVKRSTLSNTVQRIISCNDGSAVGCCVQFDAANSITFQYGGTVGYANVTASLYRDPAAWMDVVCWWDTAQATDSNRIGVEVNGVALTFATVAYPVQNAPTQFGSNTGNASIGCTWETVDRYFDGYLADFYYIDGTKKTSADFGQLDPTTGVWMPKKYTGTYGNKGFHLDFSDNSNTTAATLGKDSSGMSNLLPYSDAFNNTSGWALGNNGVLTAGQSDPLGGTGAFKLAVGGSTAVPFVNYGGYNFSAGQTTTFTMYAKAGAATAMQFNIGNLNGVAYQFALSTGTIITGAPNGTGSNISAEIVSAGGGWWKCSVTAKHNTAGTDGIYIAALGTTTNGEDVTIFRADLYNGSVIAPELQYTNGIAVPDKNFTPNNFSVAAGVGNDSIVDTPTNYGADTGVGGEVRGNYATMSPNDADPNCTISNGNLLVGSSSSVGTYRAARSGFFVRDGLWYAEAKVSISGVGACVFGLFTPSDVFVGVNGYPGFSAGSYGMAFIAPDRYKLNNGASTLLVSGAPANGDTWMIALDLNAGKIYCGSQGTWLGGANPVTGANPAFTGLVGPLAFGVANNTANTTMELNFGQRPFAYTAPTGFKALCTQNLPNPAIVKPSQYFDTVLYSGDETTNRQIPMAFRGDLWISKSRNLAQNNAVVDSQRASLWLATNLGNQEFGAPVGFYDTGLVASKIDTGAPTDMWNDSGNNYVGWVWKKGVVPGLDVVAFNSPASGVFAVPHSLGVKPAMIITKCRGAASSGWGVWHQTFADQVANYLSLHLTDAVGSIVNCWGAGVTSSQFGLNAGVTAPASQTNIAYVFAEVPGFSRFGSYVGNGVADGSFVWCGFRPRYVLAKVASTTGNWGIRDTSRSPVNPADQSLYANDVGAEILGASAFDLLSNGFKMRGTGFNNSGATIIFAAFAEAPFKFARAR